MKKRTLGIFASIFAVVAIVAIAFNVVTAPGNQPPLSVTVDNIPLEVEVTNWPVSTDVLVWWYEHIDNTVVKSPLYNANGFSQLHVLAVGLGLGTTETVTITIYSLLLNSTGTEWLPVEVAQITLDEDNLSEAITIPVPSDAFVFSAYSAYECEVSLSFYLTWA